MVEGLEVLHLLTVTNIRQQGHLLHDLKLMNPVLVISTVSVVEEWATRPVIVGEEPVVVVVVVGGCSRETVSGPAWVGGEPGR